MPRVRPVLPLHLGYREPGEDGFDVLRTRISGCTAIQNGESDGGFGDGIEATDSLLAHNTCCTNNGLGINNSGSTLVNNHAP